MVQSEELNNAALAKNASPMGRAFGKIAKSRNLKLRDISAATGLSLSALSKIFLGQSNFTLRTLIKLLRVLKIKITFETTTK